MGGKSKSVTVGYKYGIGFHSGIGIGPIDAYLELRGGDKTAWKGEATHSQTLSINAPMLWGGDKDQGGIVGELDLMFGEADQMPSARLTRIFGDQQPAWRGLFTAAYEGEWGSMNPYPQKASHKIRKIKAGWDGECWYPEKAEISLKVPPAAALYFALDLSGSMGVITSNGKTRLRNMQDAIMLLLDQLGEAIQGGSSIDVMIVGFGDPPNVRQSIVYRAATSASIASLKAWVDSRATVYGTYFTAGVMDMPAFFSGSSAPRKLSFLVTDGEPAATGMTPGQIADEARAIVQSVDGMLCYGINIDLNDTTYTKRVQNAPGPVAVAKGGDPGTITGVIRAAIFGGLLAMNPAHALYYARTHGEIGRTPVANINDASYRAGADRLYAEGFGICTEYDPSAESLEEFEQRICKLIGGSVSRSLIDGQYYLDLARGEYVLADLPVISDDDIIDFKLQPSVLDGAVNSVSIKYFDPERKESINTPPAQVLALIDAFGTIHQDVDYSEIPDAALAARLAERDVRLGSTPTRAQEIVVIPDAVRALRPNQYFRLQSPKRRIADMVCLLGEKQGGTLKSGGVKIVASEDTYSLPTAAFVEVEPGVDTRPDVAAAPITAQAAFEAPYIELVQRLDRANLEKVPNDVGYLLAVADQPSAGGRNYDLAVADSAGSYSTDGIGDWCPVAVVAGDPSTDIVRARETTISLSVMTRVDQVVAGSAALWDAEIVRVDSVDVAGGAITVGRGCADTVPSVHAAGSRIWFYDDAAASNLIEYASGEDISVKLLTNTPSAQLDTSQATPMVVAIGQRQARPYPPGRLRVNGDPAPSHVEFAFDVSWAHRDRVAQSDQLFDAEAVSIGPEVGVTYNVRFYLNGVMKGSELGIAASTISGYSISGNGRLRIEVEAERDGLVSLQAAAIEFDYIGAVQLSGTLPNATWDEPYSATLIAIGGTMPYAWSLGTGAPPEFSIDSSTGVISGTPTTVGTYTFNVTVADANTNTDTSSQTIKVEDDIYWSSVRSLLHFNGVDAATTVTDQKSKVWTASGNAQLDTAQAKFGTTSLLLDGSGDFLTTPYAPGHFDPANDFTIELWVRPSAAKRSCFFSTIQDASFRGVAAALMSNGTVRFYGGTGTTWPVLDTTAPTIPLNEWTHIAITKQGMVLRAFVGGHLAGQLTLPAQLVPSTTGGVMIGRDLGESGTTRDFQGWIDDFRYTDGVCRYTADFTPPATAFPNGGA